MPWPNSTMPQSCSCVALCEVITGATNRSEHTIMTVQASFSWQAVQSTTSQSCKPGCFCKL